MNYHPSLLNLFKQNNFPSFEEFLLLDVGASGGIENYWLTLGDKLKAVGFDPLTSEVKRLNQENKNSNILYEEGFVTYNKLDQNFPMELRNDPIASLNNSSYERSSSVRAATAKNYNYIQEHFNAGEPACYSSKYFELDDYVKDKQIRTVDFIKIDTDGHDFPVLLGAEQVLDQKGVLGLSVECQFHGSTHPYANTFSNIDQFLRSKGFSLFNLDVWKYSRAALPCIFNYDIFAQTQTGPVQWGEAVYFRDLADKNYEQKFNYKITNENIIKLAFLYELFGLTDCAVELLIEKREQVNSYGQLEKILNSLTPLLRGKKLSYQNYICKFDENPELWLPILVILRKKFKFLIPILKRLRLLNFSKKIYNLLKK